MAVDFSNLNPSQKEAVEYIDGPSLVIAGAGSGKTRVLTSKIAYLIESGINPFEILALTFTNKAANEMKERIIKLVGRSAESIWMGTFHSVFARILRSEAGLIGFARDFTIYDIAFRAAEKYRIKVYADIFPTGEKTSLSGFKAPQNDEHLQSIADCIKALVAHFRDFPCLYAWMLMNETGIGNANETAFTRKKYGEWLTKNPQPEFSGYGFPVLVDLSQQRFVADYNTWYLKWLTDEIRKYDPGHEIHVNSRALLQWCGAYHLKDWRDILTIFGASTHAAWHFGAFSRTQYAVAMAASCEMLKAGAGKIPWIVTELQGGNNTYSGNNPLCPTPEEIPQWLWIITGSGGKGSIFWTLKAGATGVEAGEWGLLDYDDKPSDRMSAASEVAAVLKKNTELFSEMVPLDPGIDILYVHESLWIESFMTRGSVSEFEARKQGAVLKSALGYYEALCEMGINPGLRALEEYDFTKDNYEGKTIILANQIAIPRDYIRKLETFVEKGGKLIADGMTGFYDENVQCMMNTGDPLKNLFGAGIKEYKASENIFTIDLEGLTIQAHYMKGILNTATAKAIATSGKEVLASKNQYGKGEVFWIPSLIGLGSRIENNYLPLSSLLKQEASSSISGIPAMFSIPQKNLMMKTLQSGNSFLTVIISKSSEKKKVQLKMKNNEIRPYILYDNKGGKVTGNTVNISPEETIVIHWK